MKTGMIADRYTFDTNLLFYSLDERFPEKHLLARALIGQADPDQCPLMLQTLGELCNSTAKKRRELLPQAEQLVFISRQMFEVVPALPEDIPEALLTHQAHNIQFWDALLWATARRAGCTLLLTEDLQDGRVLGNVTFRNPFSMSTAELEQLLA